MSLLTVDIGSIYAPGRVSGGVEWAVWQVTCRCSGGRLGLCGSCLLMAPRTGWVVPRGPRRDPSAGVSEVVSESASGAGPPSRSVHDEGPCGLPPGAVLASDSYVEGTE